MCPAPLLVGQRWKGVCTGSQGGDFSLSYVPTSKLHLQTALDPAFFSPALCLYPHWQPQRISTGDQPGSCGSDMGGSANGSGLLDGPGTGTHRLWAGCCSVRNVSSLLSLVSLLLSQHSVQLTCPRAAALHGTEPAAGSASPCRAPRCSHSAC